MPAPSLRIILRTLCAKDAIYPSHTEVTDATQADVDRLAGVTNSVMPRFFLGDPTEDGWTSEPGTNNGGLRWLRAKVAELKED